MATSINIFSRSTQTIPDSNVQDNVTVMKDILSDIRHTVDINKDLLPILREIFERANALNLAVVPLIQTQIYVLEENTHLLQTIAAKYEAVIEGAVVCHNYGELVQSAREAIHIHNRLINIYYQLVNNTRGSLEQQSLHSILSHVFTMLTHPPISVRKITWALVLVLERICRPIVDRITPGLDRIPGISYIGSRKLANEITLVVIGIIIGTVIYLAAYLAQLFFNSVNKHYNLS